MPTEERSELSVRSFRSFVLWVSTVAFAVLVLSIFFDWGRFDPFQELAKELAEAVIIAMLLALTVDIYLKTELARDAIKVAIGYVLPNYLKDEMVAIYSNELNCEDHNQILTLTPIADGRIHVRLRVERMLKNIGTGKQPFDAQLIVDEWLVSGHRSIIREFGYKNKGREQKEILPARPFLLDGGIPRVTISLPATEVAPNDTLVVWWEVDEIRFANDVHVTTLRYSTNRPRVRVAAPNTIGWMVEFPHRMNPNQFGDTTVLPALLLPSQSILIRWWDKSAEATWRTAIMTETGASVQPH